jgi:hypothetical protein
MILRARLLLAATAVLLGAAPLRAAQGYDLRKPQIAGTVVGAKFDVVVDDHGTKRKATLLFKTKDLFSAYLSRWHITAMPFTEKPGTSEADPVAFTAVFTDSVGSTITCTGTATGDAIVGELVAKPNGAAEDRLPFTGGKSGTPAAKKALESLKP